MDLPGSESEAVPRTCSWRRGLRLAARVLLVLPLLAGARVPAGESTWPGESWEKTSPGELGLDGKRLEQARDYALTGKGAGMIVRHGKLVLSWGDTSRRYDLKSTTKSIGVTALGLAIGDGKVRLEDKARKHHPGLGVPPESNRKKGWLDEITVHHLATQTAGFEKPGGYEPLVFRAGTRWKYSDGGPNWLAECLTRVYRRDLSDLLYERVFTPLGIEPSQLSWRKNAYRPAKIEGIPRREFGSGIHASVDAMARIGYLYLRKGRWRGHQLLPRGFVDEASRTPEGQGRLPVEDAERFGKASRHYGLLWWNNSDGTLGKVPRDAYWSWGLYDSLIVVFPSLDLVVTRAGSSWKRKEGARHYDVLAPFLEPIVLAAGGDGGAPAAPGSRS
jgi:CubicO group peptidase (beta-lactamase class C family)